MQHFLEGKNFNSREEVEANFLDFFDSKPPAFFVKVSLVSLIGGLKF